MMAFIQIMVAGLELVEKVVRLQLWVANLVRFIESEEAEGEQP
jgi:hypothetical protein